MDENKHNETFAEDESDDEFFDCIEETNTPYIDQAISSVNKELTQTPTNVSLSSDLPDDESEDEEDHFVDAMEYVETECLNPTVQITVSSSPILAVAEIKSDSFQQAKANIKAVIDEHIRRVHDDRLKLYYKKPVDRRANELITEVNGAIDMESLANCIAKFILTGQTKSDHALQRSYTGAKNCLRRMIIDAFCPQFLNRKWNYISPRLFSKTSQIKNMLNLCPDKITLQRVCKNVNESNLTNLCRRQQA